MNIQRIRTHLLDTKRMQQDALRQALAMGLGNDPAMAPMLEKMRSSIAQIDEGIAELDAASANGNSISSGLVVKLVGLITAAMKIIDWWLHRP